MLKQKLALSYSSKIFIQFLQIIASIVVARIAGPTVLGTVSFGMAYAGMFKFIASLGLNHAHIRLINDGNSEADCIATYSRLKIFTTILYVVSVALFFGIQKYVFNVEFESKDHQIVIFIYILTVVVQSIGDIPVNTFAAKMEQAKQDLPNIIRNIVLQLLRILVVVIGLGAVALALSNLVSFILVLFISFYLFRKYPRGNYDKNLAKKYFMISIPLFIYTFSAGLTNSLDKVLLQFFTNSHEVGLYTVSFKLGNLIRILGSSMGLLFFPLFSKALLRNDYNYVNKVLSKYLRFCYLFLMPFTIFIAIYSEVIINIMLGNEYSKSIIILSIVTISIFIELINLPYANIILGKGLFKLTAILNFINVIFLVLCIVLLVNPKLLDYGSLGAAISFLLSKIFISSLYFGFSRKYIPTIKHLNYNKYMIFGLFNLVFFYLIYQTYVSISSYSMKIIFAISYFIITYGFFFLFGWIEKKDFTELFDLLNIQKMKTYIGKEFKK